MMRSREKAPRGPERAERARLSRGSEGRRVKERAARMAADSSPGASAEPHRRQSVVAHPPDRLVSSPPRHEWRSLPRSRPGRRRPRAPETAEPQASARLIGSDRPAARKHACTECASASHRTARETLARQCLRYEGRATPFTIRDARQEAAEKRSPRRAAPVPSRNRSCTGPRQLTGPAVKQCARRTTRPYQLRRPTPFLRYSNLALRIHTYSLSSGRSANSRSCRRQKPCGRRRPCDQLGDR
ncbi:hypothetical protein HPB50_016355 [Hyalomma asiaticum]|uniref:Uncharacterized protein n=1 Tax=Hyalomma asiaticum TaxID=266040 RepID=A0ACB7SMD8_HYAAI|nr:hypothetical protein HPB50_016355 [Hyalomma asiaticum]